MYLISYLKLTELGSSFNVKPKSLILLVPYKFYFKKVRLRLRLRILRKLRGLWKLRL